MRNLHYLISYWNGYWEPPIVIINLSVHRAVVNVNDCTLTYEYPMSCTNCTTFNYSKAYRVPRCKPRNVYCLGLALAEPRRMRALRTSILSRRSHPLLQPPQNMILNTPPVLCSDDFQSWEHCTAWLQWSYVLVSNWMTSLETQLSTPGIKQLVSSNCRNAPLWCSTLVKLSAGLSFPDIQMILYISWHS